MVFYSRHYNCNKQFSVDVIIETVISAKAAFIPPIKSSKRVKLSQWSCNYGRDILWIAYLYFATYDYH